MNYQEYALELIKLNQHRFAGYAHQPKFFAANLVGLGEEIVEFILSEKGEPELKEVGDVLAYATLTIAAIHAHNVDSVRGGIGHLSQIAELTAVDLQRANELSLTMESNDLLVTLLAVLGAGKRFLREDRVYDPELSVKALAEVLHLSMFGFSEVAEENVKKLTGRLHRGTLFRGMGDNR